VGHNPAAQQSLAEPSRSLFKAPEVFRMEAKKHTEKRWSGSNNRCRPTNINDPANDCSIQSKADLQPPDKTDRSRARRTKKRKKFEGPNAPRETESPTW
jgi:hypothetical protein